jgi:hypothetical protein
VDEVPWHGEPPVLLTQLNEREDRSVIQERASGKFSSSALAVALAVQKEEGKMKGNIKWNKEGESNSIIRLTRLKLRLLAGFRFCGASAQVTFLCHPPASRCRPTALA